MQVMMEHLHRPHASQHLPMKTAISSFMPVERAAYGDAHVLKAVWVRLREQCPRTLATEISVHMERLGMVNRTENQAGGAQCIL